MEHLHIEPHSLKVLDVSEGEPWVRVYETIDGYADQNPGFGSTRFAPFPGFGDSAGHLVPTMYLARSLEAALMETVLHTVDAPRSPRALPPTVSGNKLLGRAHARLLVPRTMRLLDLRDSALEELGVPRVGVVSSSALHYPCTRRIAESVHRHPEVFDGIVWHSRQAELARLRASTGIVIAGDPDPADREPKAADEVMVLFGTRVADGRGGGWRLAEAPDSNGSLFEGEGRAAVVRVAAEVGAGMDWNFDGR